jgi:putative flavoprotein involved in K+ transport
MSGNPEGSPPMTTTAQQTEAAIAVTTWLEEFSAALAANDPARAAALFTEDCFWRDLISFTWNIRTFEGRAEITRMLEAALSRVQPTGWTVTDGEEPAETDGITEAWINFETSVGRGHGHVRLRGGQCWTLLTTLYELKGYEESKGLRRPMGAEHGVNRDRTTWLEDREYETQKLGVTEQPYVLIVGGGKPASGSRRGSGSSVCPRSSSTSAPARVTSGAAGTSRSACTTPSGTTTCRT